MSLIVTDEGRSGVAVGRPSEWMNRRSKLGSYCCAGPYMEDVCEGTISGKGNVWDWLRMYWDMHSDRNVDFDTMLEIYDDANPNSWSQYNVQYRLLDAAEENDADGWYTEAVENGVNH